MARGKIISVNPVPKEIIWFLLAKEFHWLPSQCESESAKSMKAITHILSVYNRVRNQEAERASKFKPSPMGRNSQMVDLTDPKVEAQFRQMFG